MSRACWNLLCPTQTYSFSNFPKAIVAFGSSFCKNDYEKFQDHLGTLKTFTMLATEALEYAQICGHHLQTCALITGLFTPMLNVLFLLVRDADQLYKKLKNVEQNIFNTILDGKIRAIGYSLKNLNNTETTEVQKVAEIVNVISHLNELLPVFSNEKSIFRVRFNYGAPLFARFCIILKAISLIAENTTDYNTSNLRNLKGEYQKVLYWYQEKCIGSRMASCYVKKMLSIKGDHTWTNDWDRHYENYKDYYDGNTKFPWLKYGHDLGGKGWKLWCGEMTFCKPRTHDEVEFEPFDIENTSAKILSNGDIEYHRDVLFEYRRRVRSVMLGFFYDCSPTIRNTF